MKKRTTMIDDIDDLKRRWQQAAADTSALDRVNRQLGDRLAQGKVTSLQENLASRIRRMRWVGLFVILYSPVVYFTLPVSPAACIIYALFGAVMTVLHQLLADYIGEHQLVDMPVADAIRRAVKIKVYQTRMRVVGICFGTVVVLSLVMCLVAAEQQAALLGAAVGLCLGLCIGIPRCVRNARMARRLIESLSTDSCDTCP